MGTGATVVVAVRGQQIGGVTACEMCGHKFEVGEKVCAGDEVAHKACVTHWFRAQYGREGLA